MAIATLERCYNNPNVFTGVVKIRKGETVRMMLNATKFENVKAIMKHFTLEVSTHILAKTTLFVLMKKLVKNLKIKVLFCD